jgi:hypothetical protein
MSRWGVRGGGWRVARFGSAKNGSGNFCGFLCGFGAGCRLGSSHDYTVFAVLLGSHLIGLEVLNLFHIDGSPALFTNKLNSG